MDWAHYRQITWMAPLLGGGNGICSGGVVKGRCRSPTSVEWKDCRTGCAPVSRAHGHPAGSADMLVGEWYPRQPWFCPSIHPPIFV